MSRSITSAAAAFAAVFGLCFIIGAVAHAAPKLINVTMSKTERGANTETFEPSAAKIFLNFKLEDVAPGTKLTCKWIALDTNGISPPNYLITSTDFVTKPGQDDILFSLGKPTGFPIGSYRVDIFVGDKFAQSVNFKVAR